MGPDRAARLSRPGLIRRAGLASCFLATLALGLVGCSSEAASPIPAETLTIDCAAFESAGPGGQPVERDVALSVGQTLVVTLCSNASTGFAWEQPVWSGDESVELVGVADDAPATALPGAAGTQVFTFRGTAAGTTLIEFTYSQPWAGGMKGTWRLALTVTVS